MANDRNPSGTEDEHYEGLRRRGMSKGRAAGIASTQGASKMGGKNSAAGSSSQSSKRSGLAGAAVAAASGGRFSFDILKPRVGLACAGRGQSTPARGKGL
jgi:hypothetical protein